MRNALSIEYLREMRNRIQITTLIADILKMEYKIIDERFRFPCPICREFDTAVNINTNLARCFRCRVNFNPIEIVMRVKRCAFLDAVRFLAPLLKRNDMREEAYRDRRMRFPIPAK